MNKLGKCKLEAELPNQIVVIGQRQRDLQQQKGISNIRRYRKEGDNERGDWLG